MSKRVLERYWNGDPDLRKHPKVSGVFEQIRCDIRAGRVFPALRENEIHLYHEGGRVLRIRPQSVYTHRKYAHGCGDRNGEESLCSLTNEKYQEIKKGCRCHNRKPDKETWIVSRLFKRFSVWADGTECAQPKLIDIEVRLRPDQSEKASQMIDLLFLGDAGHLTFVEVKRQYDSRVRSQATPEVVGQICEYERTLSGNQDTVVCAYAEVSRILGTAFCLKGFEPPRRVFGRVPILVCRRDAKVGRDTWLQRHLSRCAEGEIDPGDLVVDGGAIRGEAYPDKAPPWCKNGLWKHLDLKTVFEKIHGLERP